MSDKARVDTSAVLEFMFRLGQAHIACGEQTARVELLLRRVAAAYGMRHSRVVVFPTAIFISLHDSHGERITLAEGPAYGLRLDQIAEVYALSQDAERGELAPRDGLERLAAILRHSTRFGASGVVLGHALLTIGLAMVLKPSIENLAAAGVLGAIVGLVKLVNRDRPVLAVPSPVVAAAIVSALVLLAQRRGLPVDPAYMILPPLITFLPGAMLTLGMVELAYGEMISGTSRLITGFVQLVLLTVGLAIGAALAGLHPQSLADVAAQSTEIPWGEWGPWLAVVVFGAGVFVHSSAPPRSFRWIVLVLLAAFAAQQLAAPVFGEAIGGFFGMVVATPLGYLIQLRLGGPPAMVTFLPSFWLVVPGSLGLRSVALMLTDRAAGVDGIVSVVFAITSIALGTLVGASIYKSVSERFGSWRLQLGRVKGASRTEQRNVDRTP